jgi:hypothetical protein
VQSGHWCLLSVTDDDIVPPLRNFHRVRVVNTVVSGNENAANFLFFEHDDVLRVVINSGENFELFLQRSNDLPLDFSVRASVVVPAHMEVLWHKVPDAKPVRCDSTPHLASNRDEDRGDPGSLRCFKKLKDFLVFGGSVSCLVEGRQMRVTVI